MIRLIGKIPKKVTVACSGGLDSMVVTDFLLNGRREVSLAYFNHDTSHGKEAESFLCNFAETHSLPLLVGRCYGTKGRRSFEEFWRDERYSFLEKINSNFIITCHHLDDNLETWVMSSCHGQPKMIPYRRGEKIFRPFLMTPGSTLKSYAEKNEIQWIEDPSNLSTCYARNHTRHKIIPEILKLNPGVRTMLRKKLVEKYKNTC